MTQSPHRAPPLTRRKLLFGLGSAAGTGVISPSLAVASAHGLHVGSENRIGQAELDQIAVRHQLWLDRKTGGEFAVLSGRDLSGLEFGRWDLRHASFAGANLSRIHATDTRFCYCDFTTADLTDARAFDCDFRATRLKQAILLRAIIVDTKTEWQRPTEDEDLWYCGGGLMEANLEGADLRYAYIGAPTSDAWFG